MTETVQVRFMLKFEAQMAGRRVDFVSVDMHHDYEGMDNLPSNARVIAFDLDIPVSLWEPPLIKGTVKTQLESMLTDFVEGMETIT